VTTVTTGRRLTRVWLVLLAATCGSSLVGAELGAASVPVAAVIIAVALFKVRLIGIHFMELRVAPPPLRWLFEGYVLVVFATLTTLDLTIRR
jgi:caa(3)-type oxidase subunit IV